MSKQQPEYELQCQIAEYLCRQYPNVLFASDVKGSIKLTIPQAVRWKKLQKPGFAQPDLVIFEKRKGYGALFLELKAESPYRKDGTLKKSEHLQAQMDSLLALERAGYFAVFCWEFSAAKCFIDSYLRDKPV